MNKPSHFVLLKKTRNGDDNTGSPQNLEEIVRKCWFELVWYRASLQSEMNSIADSF